MDEPEVKPDPTPPVIQNIHNYNQVQIVHHGQGNVSENKQKIETAKTTKQVSDGDSGQIRNITRRKKLIGLTVLAASISLILFYLATTKLPPPAKTPSPSNTRVTSAQKIAAPDYDKYSSIVEISYTRLFGLLQVPYLFIDDKDLYEYQLYRFNFIEKDKWLDKYLPRTHALMGPVWDQVKKSREDTSAHQYDIESSQVWNMMFHDAPASANDTWERFCNLANECERIAGFGSWERAFSEGYKNQIFARLNTIEKQISIRNESFGFLFLAMEWKDSKEKARQVELHFKRAYTLLWCIHLRF